MSASPDDGAFTALLEFLKRTRGLDFTGYKRTSLERRIRRRMEAVGCAGFGDYLDFLEVQPDEYVQLFDTLLINVTEFFRDQAAWQHLREHVLPALLAEKDSDSPVRVWERRLRERPGGVHDRHGAGRGARRAGLPGPRQDLRHRHRRGRARPGPARRLHGQGDGVGAGGAAGAPLRARPQEAGVPQGPAPHGDLRPQQPGLRRAPGWTCWSAATR